MTMKNIRHTGIVVTDMERSLRFYRELLGLEPVIDFTEESDLLRVLAICVAVLVRYACFRRATSVALQALAPGRVATFLVVVLRVVLRALARVTFRVAFRAVFRVVFRAVLRVAFLTVLRIERISCSRIDGYITVVAKFP